MRVILILMLAIVTIPSSIASLPSEYFLSVTHKKTVATALKSKKVELVQDAIKVLSRDEFTVRYDLYAFMLDQISLEISPRDRIKMRVGYNGKEMIDGQIQDVGAFQDGTFDQLDTILEQTIFKTDIQHQKEYLALLHKLMFLREIAYVAAREAPLEHWFEADYEPVISFIEFETQWGQFVSKHHALWMDVFPEEKDWTSNKLSYMPNLNFPGYDLVKASHGTGWLVLDKIWGLISACTTPCKRKVRQNDMGHLMRALKVRLFSYALTPDFKAVFNSKLETRYFPLSYGTLLKNALHPFRICRPDLQAIGNWRPAIRRTELPAHLQKALLRNMKGKKATIQELTAFDLVERLTAEKNRLEQQLSKARDKNSAFKKERDSIKQEAEAARTIIAALESGEELASQREQYQKLEEKYALLSKKHEQARGLLIEYSSKIEELEASLKSFAAELSRKNKQLDETGMELGSLRQQIEALESELASVRELAKEADSSKDAAESKVIKLQQELEEAIRISGIHEHTLLAKKEEYNILKGLLEEKESAVRTLEQQLADVPQQAASNEVTTAIIDQDPAILARSPSPDANDVLSLRTQLEQQTILMNALSRRNDELNMHCWKLDGAFKKALHDLTALQHATSGDVDVIHVNVDNQLVPFTPEQLIYYATIGKQQELQQQAAFYAQAAPPVDNNNNNEGDE